MVSDPLRAGPLGNRRARDAAAAQRCRAAIEQVYSDGCPAAVDEARDDPEMLLLVTGWFCNHPSELQRTLSPAKAEE